MQLNDLRQRLRIALTQFIVDDHALLRVRASERCMASQLAFRLRALVEQSWDVDVEYNRDADIPKRAAATTFESPDEPFRHRVADISIHHRGFDRPEHNLLLLELKVELVDSAAHAHEIERLQNLQAEFGYQHAALLELGLESPSAVAGVEPRWAWSGEPSWVAEAVYAPGVASKVWERGGLASARRYAGYQRTTP